MKHIKLFEQFINEAYSSDKVKDEKAFGSPNVFEICTEHHEEPHIEENMQEIISAVHEKMRHDLIRLKER